MSGNLNGDMLYVMQIIEPNAKGSALRALRDSATGIYCLDGAYTAKYTFPMPAVDGYSGSYTTNVDGGNNANGDYEGVVISSKVNISAFSWSGLSTATGRELLQIFEGGRYYTFFARYFDVVRGEYVIRQFSHGDIEYDANNIITVVENGSTKLDVDYWKNIKIPVKEV